MKQGFSFDGMHFQICTFYQGVAFRVSKTNKITSVVCPVFGMPYLTRVFGDCRTRPSSQQCIKFMLIGLLIKQGKIERFGPDFNAYFVQFISNHGRNFFGHRRKHVTQCKGKGNTFSLNQLIADVVTIGIYPSSFVQQFLGNT